MNEDEFKDQLAELRASMDQMREGMKELASCLWEFYKGLTGEGFAPDQALLLTGQFMVSFISGIGRTDDE